LEKEKNENTGWSIIEDIMEYLYRTVGYIEKNPETGLYVKET